jgi:lipoprotein-anchoring transpeptidase ErfK/SrfK
MYYRDCRNSFYIQKIVCVVLLLITLNSTYAQTQQISEYNKPKNLKVIGEYDDGRGNMIREIQYTQGAIRVTETIYIPKVFTGIGIKPKISIDTLVKDSIWVLVDKGKYVVQIYYKKRLIRGYRAVFGPDPKLNKCMEGDRCTPEGWYKIANKHVSSKYNKFMLLDYPTSKNYEQFNKLKEAGKIPKNARIGGDVGIHGIWPKGDDMIEMGIGWTDGCIALKNIDIDDLYTWVRVGTRVYIRH